MPISRYDRFYGGKKGSASKALSSMRERYGEKRGTSIFYAMMNARKNESNDDKMPRSKYSR